MACYQNVLFRRVLELFASMKCFSIVFAGFLTHVFFQNNNTICCGKRAESNKKAFRFQK